MSKEKQIEEIARVLCGMESSCDKCMFKKTNCYEHREAEEIYNAGYRKQSEGEWISVGERLPSEWGEYLTYGHWDFAEEGEVEIHGFGYDRWDVMDEYIITHWMPLPESPKMKGGAE